MPTTPAVPDGGRLDAAELNRRIRALWHRAGGRLSPEQQVEYQQLVTAWAAAVRAETTLAA